MAGIFSNIGKVFIEDGAWYKIMAVCALWFMMFICQRIIMPSVNVIPSFDELNFPAIILYLLASILFTGFFLQICQNGMREEEEVLPRFDLAGMFVCFVRFIPFFIVWFIYLFSAGYFIGFLGYHSSKTFAVVMIVLLWVMALITGPILIALHAKNFSYKYVLNPITPFRLLGKVFIPMFFLNLAIIIISVILFIVLWAFGWIFALSSVAPGSDGLSGVMPAFLVFLYVFIFVNCSVQAGLCRTIADIAVENLSRTEFLGANFDIPSEDTDEDGDSDESDESLDY